MSMFYELMMKKKSMPSRYQEVEYIESDGTQYIDTGIILSNIPNLKIEFCISDFSSGRFGTQRSNYLGITNWALCPFISNNNSYIQFGGSGTEVVISSTPLQKHNYFVDIENQKIIIDNQTEISTSFSTTNAIDNFFLFADNFNQTANNFASAKVYCFRFYSGSTLIRNFIPVYDTLTNKYGMWESVQGKFYGNDGTGDFKGSIVGYTIVGSPTITDGVVSGFSSGNYLRLTNITFGDIEFVLKIKTPNSSSSIQQTIFYSNYNSGAESFAFRLNTTNQILVNLGNSGSITSSNALSLNTDYWVKIKIDNTNKNLKVEYSTNGTTYTQIGILNNISLLGVSFNNCVFGLWNATNRVFNGSIDMNETYIKVNNKLWFNGQQS